MAGEPSDTNLSHQVDDFCFSALSDVGELLDGEGVDVDDDDNGNLFPISDDKYAAKLQLQEMLMSSAIAAASQAKNKAEAATRLIAECSASASSSSSTVTMLFCKICMEAVQSTEAHQASRDCPHAFCRACLAGHIGAKVQESIANVKCPEVCCDSVLDPELCQGIVPKEVFERWGSALCEAMVFGAKKVYCPFEGCTAMMVVDDDGSGGNGSVVTQSECPSCNRLFCARCAVPWHAEMSCEEVEKLPVGERGREDMTLIMEVAKEKKWKRCPRCRFFVEKTDGCLHITCRCGFEFCYGCGNKWSADHTACSTA